MPNAATTKQDDQELTGLQKAAVLLIALGPEKSALIFKHLKDEEIEELTLEIANTRTITPQIKENVINEFIRYALHSSILLRAVSETRRNFLKSHLAQIGLGML